MSQIWRDLDKKRITDHDFPTPLKMWGGKITMMILIKGYFPTSYFAATFTEIVLKTLFCFSLSQKRKVCFSREIFTFFYSDTMRLFAEVLKTRFDFQNKSIL